MYEKLIDALAPHATIKRATNSGSALRYLTENSPSAIIVTDSGITDKSNHQALEKLKSYLTTGGTVIFGCHFSGFISPPAMNKLWRDTFNLPWEMGDYHRTDVQLNQSVSSRLRPSSAKLKAQYSQKTVFLKGVGPADVLYAPTLESRVQSLVFAASEVDQQQTPVAWKAPEGGWIEYVRDVNAEVDSDEVYLAMCGL